MPKASVYPERQTNGEGQNMKIKHPLLRLLVVIGFLIPVFVVNKLFKLFVLSELSGNTRVIAQYMEAVLFFLLFILAYRVFVRWIEHRQAFELSTPGATREFSAGFGVGLGLVTIMVILLYILGYYQFESVNPNLRLLLDYFIKFTMGAFLEELIFRLIVFKLTEEMLGTWWAVLIQAVLFGLAHIGNDNATIWTSAAIMIIGGLLETSAFIYTRRLWLALGLHAGWNYFQSGIFGMPNSGSVYDGVLRPVVIGPEWLTGGDFGIEASYVAISMCLVVGLCILFKARSDGKFVLPRWRAAERIANPPKPHS
jgi:membrane protease YdiL (CAAX protease family)